MNTVSIIFSQSLIIKDKTLVIGFQRSEKTGIPIDEIKLKSWASGNLYHWYRMQDLQGKRTFNLKRPIKIEIYYDDRLEFLLTQRKVTKDMILKKNEDAPIPLKNCTYVLRPYNIATVVTKKRIALKKETEPFNSERVFNSIEYFNIGQIKYGSPIIDMNVY